MQTAFTVRGATKLKTRELTLALAGKTIQNVLKKKETTGELTDVQHVGKVKHQLSAAVKKQPPEGRSGGITIYCSQKTA